jgi:general secretion pathway protein I
MRPDKSLSSRGLTAGPSFDGIQLDPAGPTPRVKPRYNSEDATRPSRLRRNDRVSGFTLLEVMIALLVITLGIGAVLNTTSESGWKSSQLKTRTIASWVAQNQIVLYRAKRTWNNASSKSGKTEMANIEWNWKLRVSKTDDPSLRRLDVDVYIQGNDSIEASATGFIARL